METFGEFIKKRRIEKGLTLTQLGAQLGVDSGALSKIENGKKKLVDKALPKLAKVFKLDLNQVRDEYFSEMIAYEIYENKCSEKVLELAEQKARYIRIKNTKQASLDFTS
jgi:transcriptional regulator with XRE-family HTH domain